jgi:hypothetical protein
VSSIRIHITRLLGTLVTVAILMPCQGSDESRKSLDIRVDAGHQQVESSVGDEWAPTWGRDDVLYTGNDDGSSFGGIPSNAITPARNPLIPLSEKTALPLSTRCLLT